MSFHAILSPCIGVCTLDDRGYCTGCFRSSGEIAHWTQYSDGQRLKLIEEVLPEREEAFQRRLSPSLAG